MSMWQFGKIDDLKFRGSGFESRKYFKYLITNRRKYNEWNISITDSAGAGGVKNNQTTEIASKHTYSQNKMSQNLYISVRKSLLFNMLVENGTAIFTH